MMKPEEFRPKISYRGT